MINIVKKVYKKIHIIQNIFIKNKFLINKKSYAMEGEDLEIVKILKNIKDGFYVDAGGYHPLDRNNTYLLYKKKTGYSMPGGVKNAVFIGFFTKYTS